MGKRSFTDMLGNRVEIDFPPHRIISLVPSQTELLYDLGLESEVVGITKFCVHPHQWFRNKKRVGGTKTVHTSIISALQPDIIIANKEENTKEQIDELSLMYPVWVSNIQTIEDGLLMIEAIGHVVDRVSEANRLTDKIRSGFNVFQKAARPKNVAYFIWRDPWMCAGGDTFISDVIESIGWNNVLKEKSRYPQLTLEELKTKEVDIVLLSSEPYPFKESHIAEISATLPGVEVRLVDGEFFSWYGSRMLKALPYFDGLVNKFE